MNVNSNIHIRFIEDGKHQRILSNEFVCHVPRVGDEIRLGGEGGEKFYRITRVVWIYDEPECPFERVNIAVILEE